MFSVTSHNSSDSDHSLLSTSFKRTMFRLLVKTASLFLIETTSQIFDKNCFEIFGDAGSKTKFLQVESYISQLGESEPAITNNLFLIANNLCFNLATIMLGMY